MSVDLETRKKVGYILPVRIIRAVKDHANHRDCYASSVIEEAVEEYLERRPDPRKKPEPEPVAAVG